MTLPGPFFGPAGPHLRLAFANAGEEVLPRADRCVFR
jgi:hypothetical protein